MMEKIPYGKYSKGFREEEIKLVIEGGCRSPRLGGGYRAVIKFKALGKGL